MTRDARVSSALALAAMLIIAWTCLSAPPRTELTYRAEQSGAWLDAIEARIGAAPSRVTGGDQLWSVIVRTADAIPSERNLDWDGTLAFFAPCEAVTDSAPVTSAAAREIVEAGEGGSHARLYQATSLQMARVRCAESPALLHVTARSASPGEGEPSILATLDPDDVNAVGEARPGTALVVIRRTILSTVQLPLEARDGVIRLPIGGGDIAPFYAEFFSRALRAPPLARLTLLARREVSAWEDALPALGLSLLLALACVLALSRLDPTASSPRALAPVALGLALGAASAAFLTGEMTGDLGTLFARAAIEQALTIGGAFWLVAPAPQPRRSAAVVVAVFVALGFALGTGVRDLVFLAPGALTTTRLASGLGRAALAVLAGYALVRPTERRPRALLVVWVASTVLFGSALVALGA